MRLITTQVPTWFNDYLFIFIFYFLQGYSVRNIVRHSSVQRNIDHKTVFVIFFRGVPRYSLQHACFSVMDKWPVVIYVSTGCWHSLFAAGSSNSPLVCSLLAAMLLTCLCSQANGQAFLVIL